HRDDVSVALELHVRARGVVRRAAVFGALLDLRSTHIRARYSVSSHRGHRICRHGGEGRRPLAQRLSVRLLHLGRHARRPRHRRVVRAPLSRPPRGCPRPASGCAGTSVVLEPVLARGGHRLGRGIHVGLSDGSTLMSDRLFEDRTPGVEEHEPTASYLSYTVGLVLAILATIASFVVAQTNLLWAPG